VVLLLRLSEWEIPAQIQKVSLPLTLFRSTTAAQSPEIAAQ